MKRFLNTISLLLLLNYVTVVLSMEFFHSHGSVHCSTESAFKISHTVKSGAAPSPCGACTFASGHSTFSPFTLDGLVPSSAIVTIQVIVIAEIDAPSQSSRAPPVTA